MANFPYLIQNRSSSPTRIEITKYGGTLSFPKGTPSTYVGNTTYAGFCLSPYSDLTLQANYDWFLQLSSMPLGVSGLVTVKTPDQTISLRYNFTGSLDDRVNWFNQNFGQWLYMSGTYQPSIFALTDAMVQVTIEDDDIDYSQQSLSSMAGDTIITIENYRVSFQLQPDYGWVDTLNASTLSMANVGDLDLTYCHYRTDFFDAIDEVQADIDALVKIGATIYWVNELLNSNKLMWNINEATLMWTADISDMWTTK